MLDDLDAAARVVYDAMTPTPQQRWPLLDAPLRHRRVGEAREPDARRRVQGARRAGLLRPPSLPRAGRARASSRPRAATTGSPWHSRRAATRSLPRSSSRTATRRQRTARCGARCRADRAVGTISRPRSRRRRRSRADRGWHMVPSFDPLLVRGVASYALELLRAVPALDCSYVPIGLGSGICGAIAARDASAWRRRSSASSRRLRRRTRGRWSSGARFRTTCRRGSQTAWRAARRCRRRSSLIRAGAERVVEVTDDEIEDAMRALFDDTHNVVEGAGAAALAAVIEGSRSAARPHGRRSCVSGGNIDSGTVRPHSWRVTGAATPVIPGQLRRAAT